MKTMEKKRSRKQSGIIVEPASPESPLTAFLSLFREEDEGCFTVDCRQSGSPQASLKPRRLNRLS